MGIRVPRVWVIWIYYTGKNQIKKLILKKYIKVAQKD